MRNKCLLLALFMWVPLSFFAQQERPVHPFSVKTNLLGYLNRDVILEADYRFNQHWSVFVNGGSPGNITYVSGLSWLDRSSCGAEGLGISAGARVFWRAKEKMEFAFKPSIGYHRLRAVAHECSVEHDWIVWRGAPHGYSLWTESTEVVSLQTLFAYEQGIGSRVFLELALGMGWNLWDNAPTYGNWPLLDYVPPVTAQLNLGYRIF